MIHSHRVGDTGRIRAIQASPPISIGIGRASQTTIASVKDANSANHSPIAVGENITAPGTTHKAMTMTSIGLGHRAIRALGGAFDPGG